MKAKIFTSCARGLQPIPVQVEVLIEPGRPKVIVAGVEKFVAREIETRVRGAWQSLQLDWPSGQILISLTPLQLPKPGGSYDLAVLLALLAVTCEPTLEARLKEIQCFGELSLQGKLRGVAGILPAVQSATDAGYGVIVPLHNLPEAQRIENARIIAVDSVQQLCELLRSGDELFLPPPAAFTQRQKVIGSNFIDIPGQFVAKRALEVAAAGAHKLLLVGAPGSGKSKLTQCLHGLLPPLSATEALTTAKLYSVSNHGYNDSDFGRPPFRMPHYSVSAQGMRGSYLQAKPGELSLAHGGVVVLDELPEFERRVMDEVNACLRDGQFEFDGPHGLLQFPARPQLLATMLPCPCGGAGDELLSCSCSAEQIRAYRKRIVALRHHFDLCVQLTRERNTERLPPGRNSYAVAEQVAKVRERHQALFNMPSGRLSSEMLDHHCLLNARSSDLLQKSIVKFALMPRARDTLRAVALTLAHLGNSDTVQQIHLLEALQLSGLEWFCSQT